ncbi:hypothetical protein, partial [Pseudooceanicola sp.]|uniref:hypothetical protein n=1 Tax=Pseudooceanicola sp. TaxID=1914328 RepID=UPI0035131A6C
MLLEPAQVGKERQAIIARGSTESSVRARRGIRHMGSKRTCGSRFSNSWLVKRAKVCCADKADVRVSATSRAAPGRGAAILTAESLDLSRPNPKTS